MLGCGKRPHIIDSYETRVGLILLARVDCVAVVGKIRIVCVLRKDGNQPRNIGDPVVTNPELSKPMSPDFKNVLGVQFVLLTMFQSLQEAISVGGFDRQKR